MRPAPKVARPAFTLFELILAIALSVTLVALIGTAINLYLTRVDGSRTQVEEAQLARSVLSMIADDIRSTAIYRPQDTSALAAMAASGAFDVDSLDQQRGGGQGGSGGGSGVGSGDVDDIDAPTGGSSGASSSGGAAGSGFGSSSSGVSSSGVSGMSGQSEDPDSLPLGLNGTIEEVYVDVTRLPSREELFATATGYTNAPIGLQAGAGTATSAATAAATAGIPRPSDLKSVRYFVRPGERVEAGSVSATSLAPEAQLRAGGLVRQEIPRQMRVWAEQAGNTAVLDSGQALIAPEVVHIQFTYFDGTQLTDVWDMRERNALPVAIEVRLWLVPAGSEAAVTTYDLASLAKMAHEYRQTVFLPMSQIGNAAGATGMGGMSSGSSSGMSGISSGSGSGSSSSASSQSGSGF